MKNNEDLQKDVQEAIKWEPLLKAAEIGVIAKDGVITLTGTVDSYAKKREAEDAAKNVFGVNAVVEKIEIHFDNSIEKDDSEIAIEVINAFKLNYEIPNDAIKIKVEDAWITLEGEVQWIYQLEAAGTSASNVPGVKGVTNYISITPNVKDEIEKKEIERALARNSSIHDRNIRVAVLGNKVILSGNVHSFYQKNEAGRIARNAPGVISVENDLIIEYS